MSIFGELKGKTGAFKDKATKLIGQHESKIHGGIEKAGSYVDNRTGGKYAGRIKDVQRKASGFVEKADRGNSADGTPRPDDSPQTGPGRP